MLLRAVGNLPSVEENAKFCWGNLICMVVGTWGGVILTIWTFSKLKPVFCKYWTSIKIKTSMTVTCIYKEYEVKVKMVSWWWWGGGAIDPPSRGGDPPSPIPQEGKFCQHVWSLINFKWARKTHPHHNLTSLFIHMWSRVGILHIGHITDSYITDNLCGVG